jgi:hypothetical protein
MAVRPLLPHISIFQKVRQSTSSTVLDLMQPTRRALLSRGVDVCLCVPQAKTKILKPARRTRLVT